ncbi:MAG: hypothetical protein NVS9B10_00880 [Nevskia sp.]
MTTRFEAGFVSRQAAALVLALGLLASPAGFADDPKLNTPAQKEAPTAFAAPEPTPVLNWGVGDGKSYWIPAGEIVAFEYLLNRFNHYAIDSQVYGSPTSNLSGNIGHRWVVDNDKFSTNQFLHPYQGAVYQNLARSAGLNFWESFGYTLAGSLLWEEAGEHTYPSINDQVASGISGNFLGEPLFRISSLLLESGGSGGPGFWRELGAALISPSTGFNRAAYGSRFDGVFRSHEPAVFTRIDLGASLSSNFHSNVNANSNPAGPPARQSIQRGQGSADFTIGYGLPGKPDYQYTRPFDYFNFEFTAATRNAFEAVFTRGLLVGEAYEVGKDYRGIWGLYGLYSYVAPQIFRVSSTAAALGTTGQWWLSPTIALQGTTLAGVGYGGGGVIHGAGLAPPSPAGDGLRDYHYGITPQGLLSLRLILGDRVSIDTTARNYYISSWASTEKNGSENIVRADVAMTVRVYNLHALTLKYAIAQRDGRYGNRPDSHQSLGTFSLGYTFLGQTRFGAVDWRPKADGGP